MIDDEKKDDYPNFKVIVMGDFIFDMKNDKSVFFFIFMLQHNLYSALHENISTTDMNTQIDVAFTYSSHYHCGTYESYFLEHKPIYICLSDGENV